MLVMLFYMKVSNLSIIFMPLLCQQTYCKENQQQTPTKPPRLWSSLSLNTILKSVIKGWVILNLTNIKFTFIKVD